jgi:hypothetical protein
MGFGNIVTGATVLHTDNQGAIPLAINPSTHQRTQHIDIKHHLIREYLQQINSFGVYYYRRATSGYTHQTTSWPSTFNKHGTTGFERTSSLRGSVGSGKYCLMVDTEV